jgi:hypothetical protein
MLASFEPVAVSSPQSKHLQESRTFQGIPGILVCPNGRVFAVWYSGGHGECADNYVVVCHSDDFGRTWSDAVAVVDPPHPDVRAYDPTMWLSPDGRVFLFWSQTVSSKIGDIFDGKAGVWYSILQNPAALPEKFQWTASIRICDGVMMNKPIVLSGGDWAMPVSVWNQDMADAENIGTKMWVSEDQGQTFYERGKVCLPKEHTSFDEHSFVEFEDGRIQCIARVTYGNAQMISNDKGRTWSSPVRSSIQGPDSRLFVSRLMSGKLILVNHDCSQDQDGEGSQLKRERMTAWLSDDDGQSWYGHLLLDERDAVSYPDGHQAEDGTIYLIHDYGRYKGGEILVSRITEQDIAAGKLIDPGSYLHVLVSKTKAVPKVPGKQD